MFGQVLDVNMYFEPYFEQNKKNFPHIQYKRTVIQPAENMSQVEDNSLDVVVSTFLHCSCQDSDAVLKEVKRVLKPVSFRLVVRVTVRRKVPCFTHLWFGLVVGVSDKRTDDMVRTQCT